MAANESSGSRINSFVGVVFSLVGIAVLLGIGYSFWPKIKAAHQSGPITVQQVEPAQPQPAPQPAPVVRPAPVYQPAPVIVQQVPAGEAPQPVHVQPPPVVADAPAVEQPAPAPRPLIIVHQVSQDGTRQTITGSGACAVAAKGARRCGDK